MILIYGYYPFPVTVRGGWMRRIAAVEALFKDRPRAYVFPVALHERTDADPLDYRLREQFSVHFDNLPDGVRFYRPDLRFTAHQRKLAALVEQADVIYAHTSHSAQHLLPFYRTGKVITDVHGIAPEEERMQGSPGRARFYESFEETMVRESAALVTVTEAMADHFRRKYPGLTTPCVHLPILDEISPPAKLERPSRARHRVIYAGGIQRWQNPDLMAEAVARTGDWCEFTFCTPQVAEFDALFTRVGVRDRVRLSCEEPGDLCRLYEDQDFGFVLRDDDPVNRVSCPTKLVEYLALGVIPIVKLAEIGDFATLGYRYVTIDDFLAGRLPDHATLDEMRRHNRGVYERVRAAHARGCEQLRSLTTQVKAKRTDHVPALFLTSFDRCNLPRDAVRLDARWSDGQEATIPVEEALPTDCRVVALPEKPATLVHLRLSPGLGPFVTSPITLRVVDEHGTEHVPALRGNHVVDRFGNWVFPEQNAWVEAASCNVPRAREVRLSYEFLLEANEAWIAIQGAPRERAVADARQRAWRANLKNLARSMAGKLGAWTRRQARVDPARS
ncbi:MAG TPA: glycosyltransferase [Planctomycetota bacterium]|nr:glycosyltransferase [Planctomycetota bacterium]